MRAMLWAVATAIGACVFWIALGQISFTVTGKDPLDLLTRGEFGGMGVAVLIIWVVGVITYAALARIKFRMEESRRERSTND